MKDEHITKVVFRKYKDNGSILALFPEEQESCGMVMCYEHVGQHGAGDYIHCISITTPATPSEYKSLQNELEGRGYNLKIRKKR